MQRREACGECDNDCDLAKFGRLKTAVVAPAQECFHCAAARFRNGERKQQDKDIQKINRHRDPLEQQIRQENEHAHRADSRQQPYQLQSRIGDRLRFQHFHDRARRGRDLRGGRRENADHAEERNADYDQKQRPIEIADHAARGMVVPRVQPVALNANPASPQK